MCPAGDNKWNEEAMHQSFSLINICPQDARLNSGLWNSIEIDCRNWARRFHDIYIVCGPILYRQEHEMIGDNQVCVPEAFFKVVLCLNWEPKGMGFVVKNNVTVSLSNGNITYRSHIQIHNHHLLLQTVHR